jgi:hypothetical protein
MAGVTMTLRGPHFFFLLLLPALAAPLSLRAQGSLFITEFMADNSRTLADEDGDFSDWLEIYNAGSGDAQLGGYYLTDSATSPRKWQFPEVTVGANRFLIVFCSGKDRRAPGGPLHTNFRIEHLGEPLFLVGPDGFTVISGFGTFPEQQPDVSYGLASESQFLTAVAAGGPVRVHIPMSDELGRRWTELDFDDSEWREGELAVGFGFSPTSPEGELIRTDVSEMRNASASIYIRIPFTVNLPEVDVMKLRVRYDDGFVAYINGQEVASGQAPEDPDWLSTATRAHNPRNFDHFDISEHAALLRPGRNVLAIHGLNATVAGSDLFILPELELIDVGPVQAGEQRYFPQPTPGEPNGRGFAETAPRPQVSLESGAYVGTIQVELSTEVEGGVLRYTLNGRLPDESSTVYSGPIDIAGPVQLTARVFKEGWLPGLPALETYIIISAALADFSSNIPVVIATTFGTAVSGTCGSGPYTPGHITILIPGEDGRTRLTSVPHVDHRAGFRRRGSSTCGRQKFSFNVEMWDSEARDANVPVFDFPVDSDYIMYAPNNFDRALIRNPLAYWMSREVGRWAARTRNVECFVHSQTGPINMSSYFGVYNFMEKNKRHDERIPVARLTASDNSAPEVTGGYILKRDRQGADEVSTSAGGYGSLVFVYPKQPSLAQRNYITQEINRTIATLNPRIGSQEDNPLIDFTAWIDHHILCWYPKNVDAFRLSGYFFKERNGPLSMGPVWDYDRTMGCSDDDRARSPEGWDNDSVGDGGTRYFEAGGLGSWYSMLFSSSPPVANTPWNNAYKARWRELRRGPLRTENITGKIDEWAAELQEPAARNFNRWPGDRPRFGSFQGEINHLKNWLSQRAAWIDTQFIETPRFNHPGGLVEQGFQVELLVGSGAPLYYTLDGQDPRGTTGMASPSAILYSGPITIASNVKIRVRSFEGGGLWSALAEAVFVTKLLPLTITEIHFNPAPLSPEEQKRGSASPTQLEFVEVTNVGNELVPLAGVRFGTGVTFTFDGVAFTDLAPRESIVVCQNLQGFALRYGTDSGIRVAGAYGGNLSNIGEALSLLGPLGETLLEFSYRADWYPETNGGGYSLVSVDPFGPTTSLGEPSRWAPSPVLNGTPGRIEALPPAGLQIPGDANRDGKLNITDAVMLLRLLFRAGSGAPCSGGLDSQGNIAVLDWDGDAALTLTDAVRSLSYLFQGGPPHARGRACVLIEGCEPACGN